jgi:hypothetical protein
MKSLSQEEQNQLDAHLKAISDILFRNSDTENIKTFEFYVSELTVLPMFRDVKIWVAQGCSWRELPGDFSAWQTVI